MAERLHLHLAPRREFLLSERRKSLEASQMRLSDQLSRLGQNLAAIGAKLPNEALSISARSMTSLAATLKEMDIPDEGSPFLFRRRADDLVKLGVALADLSSALTTKAKGLATRAEAQGGDGRRGAGGIRDRNSR